MGSWAKANLLYAYDPESKQVTDTKIQPAGPYDDAANIESVETQARSYDGTMVPLSIVYRHGLKLDGSNATPLTGYGAYGFPQTPSFHREIAMFEKGIVSAICHVRGGGEYGEEWHLAGKGPPKPNTWRDFIACAEYLVANRYTSPARLTGMGGSAGGILIGRAITDRPDLFGAAAIQVWLLDMLREETTSNGVPNIRSLGARRPRKVLKPCMP